MQLVRLTRSRSKEMVITFRTCFRREGSTSWIAMIEADRTFSTFRALVIAVEPFQPFTQFSATTLKADLLVCRLVNNIVSLRVSSPRNHTHCWTSAEVENTEIQVMSATDAASPLIVDKILDAKVSRYVRCEGFVL